MISLHLFALLKSANQVNSGYNVTKPSSSSNFLMGQKNLIIFYRRPVHPSWCEHQNKIHKLYLL